jgi:hypothetical protein
MFIERIVVDVTTAADGSATAYTPHIPHGRVLAVRYEKDATTPYADTVDFTITDDATGRAVLSVSNVTASATYAPRQPTHGTDAVAALYAAGGTAVNDLIPIAASKIKIVLAQGGDTKLGRFHFLIG